VLKTLPFMTNFSAAQIKAEGLTKDEYQMICDRLQREPNRAELGMFGVMWSEHCCYKNSRPLLKQFPATGDRVLVEPGIKLLENSRNSRQSYFTKISISKDQILNLKWKDNEDNV
jgi:phosphoribosylformylglycinamidine (FGAM) synthase-like enzyme